MPFDYNHIQTGSLIQANASPLSGRVTVFGRGAAALQEQREDEKAALLVYIHD